MASDILHDEKYIISTFNLIDNKKAIKKNSAIRTVHIHRLILNNVPLKTLF